MNNWPKDHVVICKSRPNTRAARMEAKSTEWRRFSAKRYTEEGAKRAFLTLYKKHRGMDWGVFHPPTQLLKLYTDRI